MAACRKGNFEIIKMLVEAGEKINYKGSGGYTAVHELLYSRTPINNIIKSINYLIESGADINAKNSIGRTPLLESLYARKPEISELLINKGADVNIVDRYGYFPLGIAAGMGYTKVVKLLLKHGALIAPKNAIENAIFLSSIKGNKNIVKLLLTERKKRESNKNK